MKGMGFAPRVDRILLIVLSTILFGCGGGGGGGGDDSSNGNNQVLAPNSVAGQTLILNGGSSRQIAFDSSASTWTENRSGTTHGGTYQYTANGPSAEVVLSESGVTSTIQLTFASANSGSYVAGAEQGTFQVQATPNNPNDPNPPDPGGGDGLAPGSIEGRTIHGTRTFTSTGSVGQTHVYTFTGSNFHDSDPPEESDGQYVYQPAGDRAALTLSYTAPREFNGDRHEMELTFTSASGGTFESVYTRRDGTMIQINGTFQIE